MQRLLILVVITASVFAGPMPQDLDEGQSSSNLEVNHDDGSSKDEAFEQDTFGEEEQSGFEDQQRGGYEDEGDDGQKEDFEGQFGEENYERRDRYEDGESGDSPGDRRKDF